jgi:hypothetical protein
MEWKAQTAEPIRSLTVRVTPVLEQRLGVDERKPRDVLLRIAASGHGRVTLEPVPVAGSGATRKPSRLERLLTRRNAKKNYELKRLRRR